MKSIMEIKLTVHLHKMLATDFAPLSPNSLFDIDKNWSVFFQGRDQVKI